MMRTKALFLSLADRYRDDPGTAIADVMLDASAEQASRAGDCPEFWQYQPRGNVSSIEEIFARSPQGIFSRLTDQELERLTQFSRRLFFVLGRTEQLAGRDRTSAGTHQQLRGNAP